MSSDKLGERVERERERGERGKREIENEDSDFAGVPSGDWNVWWMRRRRRVVWLLLSSLLIGYCGYYGPEQSRHWLHPNQS